MVRCLFAEDAPVAVWGVDGKTRMRIGKRLSWSPWRETVGAGIGGSEEGKMSVELRDTWVLVWLWRWGRGEGAQQEVKRDT